MSTTALRRTRDRHVPVPGSMFLSRPDADFPTLLIATPWPESAIVTTCPQGSMAMWTIVVPLVERTTADPVGRCDFLLGPVESTAEAILEIRRRSGLTWQELGELFNVSRRSIHHWANGKPVSAGNDRTIRRMLAAVRHLDRGGQRDTRALLLAVDQAAGFSLFDFLQAGQFDDAMAGVPGNQTSGPHTVPLSPAARDARRPPAPALLLGAEQDRPDIPARARIVRPKRTSRASG